MIKKESCEEGSCPIFTTLWHDVFDKYTGLKVLLSTEKVNLNVKNKYGKTPLEAASGSAKEIIKKYQK